MTLLPDVIKNKIIWYALKCPHNLQEIKGKIRVWEHPVFGNINHIFAGHPWENMRDIAIYIVEKKNLSISYMGSCDNRSAKYRTIRRNVLQTVWAIRCGNLPKSALKAMATANKIKGRSKLKTREDYVRAFLAL